MKSALKGCSWAYCTRYHSACTVVRFEDGQEARTDLVYRQFRSQPDGRGASPLHSGDRFDVVSAGTRPAGLNSNAVAAMGEIGIDISGHRSKSVDEFCDHSFAYVITVCDNARESCPLFPGSSKRVHQSFEDPATAPADEQIATFRKVRDELRDWLRDFAEMN